MIRCTRLEQIAEVMEIELPHLLDLTEKNILKQQLSDFRILMKLQNKS